MRILYLNPCGQMGGAETSLHELLASIRHAKPDWDLWLVLGEDGPLAQRARALGVQVIVAPFPPRAGKVGRCRARAGIAVVVVVKGSRWDGALPAAPG